MRRPGFLVSVMTMGVLALWAGAGPAHALTDCNGNGTPDECDVLRQRLADIDQIACRARGRGLVRSLASDGCGELYRVSKLIRGAGLRQKAKYFAVVDRPLDRVEVGITGQQYPDRSRRQCPDGRQDLDACHLRHSVSGNDDIDVVLFDDIESLGSMGGQIQFEISAKHHAHRIQYALLVVDE